MLAVAFFCAFVGANQSAKKRPPRTGMAFDLFGAPGEIRTPDRSVRSRVLYPAELRAHMRQRIILLAIIIVNRERDKTGIDVPPQIPR